MHNARKVKMHYKHQSKPQGSHFTFKIVKHFQNISNSQLLQSTTNLTTGPRAVSNHWKVCHELQRKVLYLQPFVRQQMHHPKLRIRLPSPDVALLLCTLTYSLYCTWSTLFCHTRNKTILTLGQHFPIPLKPKNFVDSLIKFLCMKLKTRPKTMTMINKC